ncbi:MAG TPA: pantoate--beta-alanine ligase [Sphingomonadaceae bacterium]|nr:pantoate--beta-alanine ligase [Sphingomonadaceae bacterium]
MQIIRTLADLRAALKALGRPVALVPTMGALHAGHMALVREARRRAATTVVSIFVNPKQFGAGEDLDRYPRQEAADAAMLEAEGVAVLWAPGVEQVYPDGFATVVSVSGLSDELDGAARPGHFDGVTTVVAKLFGQVRPDVALFGEKDWQQLAVIRRMAQDLDLDVEIAGVPVQRDADGVALSSRNVYLSAEERIAARALPRALGRAAIAIGGGAAVERVLGDAAEALTAAGLAVEYLELRDAASLGAVRSGAPARLLAAVRAGKTRLIDNVPVILI